VSDTPISATGAVSPNISVSPNIPVATHTTPSGTLTVYTTEALKAYLELQRSDEKTVSTLPFLTEFKKFPRVTDVMNTYFDEFLKSIDNKLRLAPSILVGVLSELLILTLIKALGDFLGDTNAIANYWNNKRDARMTYSITLANKAKEKIVQSRPSQNLTEEERVCFSRFLGIVNHMFDSIRLNRNEYVHPDPQTSLSTLPESDVLLVHADAFNTYAKAILKLTDIMLALS
jgi:hypothetical protein